MNDSESQGEAGNTALVDLVQPLATQVSLDDGEQGDQLWILFLQLVDQGDCSQSIWLTCADINM